MSKLRGTAPELPYNLGQFVEVVCAILKALVKAIEGTNPRIVIAALAKNGSGLAHYLREAIRLSVNDTLPPSVVNEIVELEIDGSVVGPMTMLEAAGMNAEGWEFRGKRIKGVQKRHFKLVVAGGHTLEGVRENLKAQGKIPSGLWLMAFMEYCRKTGRNVDAGIADPSWIDPGKTGLWCHYPFTYNGELRFSHTEVDFGESCLWLIEVPGTQEATSLRSTQPH